jgi:hypothetical protein
MKKLDNLFSNKINLVVIITILGILLTACDSSERKIDGLSLLTNKEHPKMWEKEDKFLNYAEKMGAEKKVRFMEEDYNDESLITYSHHEYGDEIVYSIWLQITRIKEKRLSLDKSLEIAKTYLPSFIDNGKYKSPIYSIYQDKEDKDKKYYLITYKYKDYYEDNPNKLPAHVYIKLYTDEKGVSDIFITNRRGYTYSTFKSGNKLISETDQFVK